MSLAISTSSTPYVAYKDTASPYSVTVQKFNGTSWGNVGSPAFSGGAVDFATIAINGSGTPYVAYQDHSAAQRASVMRFTGSSWVHAGATGFSAGGASFTSIAIDAGGTPYIAFEDSANSNKVTVMKFNGSSWLVVGSSGLSAGAAESISLAIDGSGTPYVAYIDFANSQKITVQKFNGAYWVNVGTPGFSVAQVASPSLAIDRSGVPYVAFKDFAYSLGATVMKYNGTSWVPVGTQGFSAGEATFTSLALNWNGTPYVAYSDLSATLSSKATVMTFDGTNWINVGSAEFSAGQAAHTALAIDASGTPFVAYEDASVNEKATVMKYTEPVPGITGTATVCAGATTTLSNTTTVGFWNSSNAAVASVGAHTGVVTGVSAGMATIYYVAYGNTVIKVVTVNPLPNAGTISGPLVGCIGYDKLFTDAVPGGVWSSSNTSVATIGTGGIATAVAPGSTTITYSVTNSCGTNIATRTFSVDYSPSMWPIVGQNQVCIGSVIQLRDASAGGVWTKSNSRVNVLSLSGISYITGVSRGLDTITYKVSTSCKDTTATFVVTVDTLPVPVILRTGIIFASKDEYPAYAWQRYGVTVLGATERWYTALDGGSMTLVVTDLNGCTGASATNTELGVGTVSTFNTRIYPNPAQNTLFIEYADATDAEVATVDGRMLFTVKDTKAIDLSRLPNDIYLVSVYDHYTGTLLKTEKILKSGN